MSKKALLTESFDRNAPRLLDIESKIGDFRTVFNFVASLSTKLCVQENMYESDSRYEDFKSSFVQHEGRLDEAEIYFQCLREDIEGSSEKTNLKEALTACSCPIEDYIKQGHGAVRHINQKVQDFKRNMC